MRIAVVAVFSDTHLASSPADGPASPDVRLAAAVDAVLAAGAPDLVVLAGDVADDGSVPAYRRAAAELARLGTSVVPVPGNHDLVDVMATELGPMNEVSVGAWRVVPADTVIAGEISGEARVEAVLAALGPDEGVPTVLVLHHPPVTPSRNEWFQMTDSDALVAALTGRSDVRLVVSGHLHTAFQSGVGPVTYLGCASTWYAIAHEGADWRPDPDGHTGALLLDLADDGSSSWRRLPV